jgi:hypothetical protein
MPVDRHPTPWRSVVLTCGKCARKMNGGYGSKGKDSLRSALRAALKDAGYGRTIRIIETRCMGICPRKATTLLNASRQDMIMTVRKGTPMDEVVGLPR